MAKKKRKSLLPKRIAGVKVPKSVRKGPLGQLLASRTGQALLAEAIMAAGAVGVAKQTNTDDGDKPPSMAGGVVADALRRWQGAGRGHGHGHGHGHGKEIDPMGATVAFALGEAARAFVRVLNEHRSQAQAHAPEADGELAAEWRAQADEPDGSKKKPASFEVRP